MRTDVRKRPLAFVRLPSTVALHGDIDKVELCPTCPLPYRYRLPRAQIVDTVGARRPRSLNHQRSQLSAAARTRSPWWKVPYLAMWHQSPSRRGRSKKRPRAERRDRNGSGGGNKVDERAGGSMTSARRSRVLVKERTRQAEAIDSVHADEGQHHRAGARPPARRDGIDE